MRASLVLVVLAAATLRPPAAAAQGTPVTPVPAPAAVAPSASAIAAATELLRLLDIEKVMRAGSEVMFDAQVQQQPLMAPFRDVMQAWLDKYMTFETMGPRLARVYAEEFTEAELRELIAFYRTPLGRKLAERTPELSRKGAEAGAAVAAEHMDELQRMIEARAVELQAQPGAP